jgi:hypothetical protein
MASMGILSIIIGLIMGAINNSISLLKPYSHPMTFENINNIGIVESGNEKCRNQQYYLL